MEKIFKLIFKNRKDVILQRIWLIEYYLLSLLSFEDIVESIIRRQVTMPKQIADFCDIVMYYLSEYQGFIWLLSFAMIATGVVASCFRYMSYFKANAFVCKYADCGCVIGEWLILINMTYIMYEMLQMDFFITTALVYLIFEVILPKIVSVIHKKFRFIETVIVSR